MTPVPLPASGRGTLVFSHANGFPAGTYRVLFEAWRAAGWRVEAIDRLGHDPAYPVTSNWPHVRDQLIGFIESLQAGPVMLVGHSLGGFLSLITACKRPDLARGVVMLDSPVVAGWRAHSLQVFKSTGLIRRVSPGKVSSRRRHHWPDQAAVQQHFESKAVFARWDPRVLADYVHAGTEPDPAGGLRLAFSREIETRFYNTLPHNVPALLQRHTPRCPIAFIGGRQSAEVRQVGMAATRALTRGRIAWLDSGHLFPMERPDETVHAVLAQIAAMSA